MRTPTKYVAKDGTITYKVRFRKGSGREAKQASETFDDYTEAEAFAKELDVLGPKLALERLYATERDPDVPEMDQLAADHIKFRTGIEPGTRLKYIQVWGTAWSPLIGHLRADDPDMRDKISEATNKLADRYKHKSLKNQRGLLAGVCDRGVEKGYMTVNPTLKLKIPEGVQHDGDDDDDMRLIQQKEFGQLVDVMHPRYRLLVKFMGGTGCRWGEVVALQKKHFDLDPADGGRGGPVVRIRRALKWSPDGKYRIGPPKTKRSRRTIALPRELVPELQEHISNLKPNDLVFSSAGGGMVMHRTFWSDHWRPAIWRAQNCADHVLPGCLCGTAHAERCKLHDQVPEPCRCDGTLSVTPRLHDVRHSHASWLLGAGIPIHVVQIRLGHESIKTTVDTYGHLLPDAQIAAAAAADVAFNQLTPHAREVEVQRALAGLDNMLTFLSGGGDLPDALAAELIARGWSPPAKAIEA